MARTQGRPRNINRFAGIEEQQRQDERAATIRRGRESYERDVARARQLQFSVRELPFAAQAFGIARAKGEPEPDRSAVRRKLEADYAFLYEKRREERTA